MRKEVIRQEVMREEVMSAGFLSSVRVSRAPVRDRTSPEVRTIQSVSEWSPERFAREQIRGLVRRLFLRSGVPAIRQVIFSAIGRDQDLANICRSIGQALAEDVIADIAVVAGRGAPRMQREPTSLKQIGTHVQQNLWLIPAECARVTGGGTSLQNFLGAIRGEFEYSIVAAPPTGESDEATAMGQFADGIVLVLSAQNTRRITACRVRQSLDEARVRLLGTVLSDREFPIPDALYRRL
jgi:hypothetical protein